MRVVKVKLSDLHQLENSRTLYKPGDLSDLMNSMKQTGLLQPIGVRPDKTKKGKYEIAFGNRRFLAAQKLGWTDIDVVMLEPGEKNEFLIMNLVENLQRKDLTAFEEGRYFYYLKEQGLTESEIASRTSVSLQRVKGSITVFQDMPAEYRDSIVNNAMGGRKKGKITARVAVKVLGAARSHSLPRSKRRELLEFAKQDYVSDAQIGLVSGMLKHGVAVENAIDFASEYKRVGISVLVSKQRAEELEKKYGKTVGVIFQDYLSSEEEFGIINVRDFEKRAKATEETEAQEMRAPTAAPLVTNKRGRGRPKKTRYEQREQEDQYDQSA